LERNGLSVDKLTIGLMPGSRTREVEVHLPIMLESAKLIYKDIPNSQFMVIKSASVSQDIFDKLLNRYSLPLKKIENVSYDSINGCDFVLVASGSATLEAAILLKPMVIIYKVSFLTWIFLKFMLKIPYVGLVNVIAEKKIIPECLQFGATPKIISAQTNRILSDQIELSQMKIDLSKVREKLGEKGAL